MKLIDADKLLEALGVFKDKKHGDPHFLKGIETAREIVEQMPEAVVRCGDCEYAESEVYKNNETWLRRCMAYSHVAYDDDYCSYGERRSENV